MKGRPVVIALLILLLVGLIYSILTFTPQADLGPPVEYTKPKTEQPTETGLAAPSASPSESASPAVYEFPISAAEINWDDRSIFKDGLVAGAQDV